MSPDTKQTIQWNTIPVGNRASVTYVQIHYPIDIDPVSLSLRINIKN